MLVPARIVRSMLLLGVALLIAAIVLDARQAQTSVTLLERDGRAAALIDGRPVAPVDLVQGGRRIRIEALDLVKDSDVFDTSVALHHFYRRQTLIAAASRAPGAHLVVAGKRYAIQPQRGLFGSPLAFWLIAVPGVLGAIVSALVLAANPRGMANRIVALTGLLFPFVTIGQAVAIPRSLAIDGELYRWLMLSHEGSAALFAVTMVALFCVYPRQIVPPRVLIPSVALTTLWVIANVAGRFLEWTHHPGFGLAGTLVWLRWASGGSQANVTWLFIALVVALAAQYRATRQDPLGRAALTWFGLSVAIGAGGFIALLTLPNLLGVRALVDGSVGFPLLLLIYAGLTFGLLRYRLFEAKEWSFRILFAAFATVALWFVDAAMIYGLGLDQGPALGASLIFVGLAYQPVRARLATLLTRRREIGRDQIFAAAIDVAFAPPAVRAARWQALMQRLFDPLEIAATDDGAPPVAQIVDDGVAMLVSDPVSGTTLRLAQPAQGSRLFSPRDRSLVEEISILCRHAAEALQSYDRGAADARRRMAQDLHDDVGARLLSGIHVADGAVKSLLQDALRDIRSLATGLIGEGASMGRVVAEIRYETASRLEAAGIDLDWPILDAHLADRWLPYVQSKAITSAIREAISNIIRHAGAHSVTVQVDAEGEWGIVMIADDGIGIAAGTPRGIGLNGIAARIAALGGSLRIEHTRGTRLALRWPFAAVATPAPQHAQAAA